MSSDWQELSLAEVLVKRADKEPALRSEVYKQVTLGVRASGARLRCETIGSQLGSAVYRVHAGDLIYSKIDARHGAFSLLPQHLDGAYVTGDFPSFGIKDTVVLPRFLALLTSWPAFWQLAADQAVGTTNRVRLNPDKLLAMRVKVPALDEQRRIVDLMTVVERSIASQDVLATSRRSARQALLADLMSAHATKRRLRDVADVHLGKTINPREAGLDPRHPYLRTANVRDGFVTLTNLKQMYFSDTDLVKYQVCAGDVLVLEGGDAGRTALYAGAPTLYQNSLHRVRALAGQSVAAHLAFAVEHAWGTGQLEALCSQTTIKHLPIGKFREFQIVCPTITEQQHIADLMTAATAALRADEVTLVAMKHLRDQLLHDLLSGTHRIPATYDNVLEETQ